MTNIKMKHPEGKRSIDVREDHVEMYESQGWVEAKTPAKPVEDKPQK